MNEPYDQIGKGYSVARKADPRIKQAIDDALMGAESILNIGAGAGSYEPEGANLMALEPSQEMIKQRRAGAAPCIRGCAEHLPFNAREFSHTMTILSMHHWSDRQIAYKEIKRVTRERFIALTWNPNSAPFWLTEDYFPEIHKKDCEIFPTTDELRESFAGIQFYPLPIPFDCTDGFTAAYWARPHAYLEPEVRAGMSTFVKMTDPAPGLERLKADLRSGTWQQKYSTLQTLKAFDAGYVLAIWDR